MDKDHMQSSFQNCLSFNLLYEDKILTALSYKETAQRFSDQQPQHQQGTG